MARHPYADLRWHGRHVPERVIVKKVPTAIVAGEAGRPNRQRGVVRKQGLGARRATRSTAPWQAVRGSRRGRRRPGRPRSRPSAPIVRTSASWDLRTTALRGRVKAPLAPRARLARLLDVDEVDTPELPIRWNVAPTQPVYAVIGHRGGARALSALRWGLVPHWASGPRIGSRLINARGETAAQRPAFRQAPGPTATT
jgi:hypothetical protein